MSWRPSHSDMGHQSGVSLDDVKLMPRMGITTFPRPALAVNDQTLLVERWAKDGRWLPVLSFENGTEAVPAGSGSELSAVHMLTTIVSNSLPPGDSIYI